MPVDFFVHFLYIRCYHSVCFLFQNCTSKFQSVFHDGFMPDVFPCLSKMYTKCRTHNLTQKRILVSISHKIGNAHGCNKFLNTLQYSIIRHSVHYILWEQKFLSHKNFISILNIIDFFQRLCHIFVVIDADANCIQCITRLHRIITRFQAQLSLG